MSVDPPAFSARDLAVDGLRLHTIEIGAGPALVFLHGFPECAAVWTPLMRRLATHRHCIAPDQRGHGASDMPEDLDAYRLDRLAHDVRDLAQALSFGRFSLVAHDWGGIVAWRACELFPESIERCVVFNAPPLSFLQRALLNDPEQRARSRYMRALRAEGAAARLAAMSPAAQWALYFGNDPPYAAHEPGLRAAILRAWARPGAWQAMVNWYRALDFAAPAASDENAEPARMNISCPALLVWGEDDALFGAGCLDGLIDACPTVQIEILEGVGHAAFREKPDLCHRIVADFLAVPVA